MTRSYIKFDPDFPERKDYYPDGAWRALVETFCYAETQQKPGRFKNEKVLRALLGARAKWIPFLVEQGDLTPTNLGFIYVEGWDEWQEGHFPTVQARIKAIETRRGPQSPAERAFLYRQRKKERDASVTKVTVTRSDDRHHGGRRERNETLPNDTPESGSDDRKSAA